MPVYQLDENSFMFPKPEMAIEDGLLAIGGDLKPERILNAYINGIFPWYDGDTIMWWSPDPRMVVFPEEAVFSKSLKQSMRNKNYEILYDAHFEEVIDACAHVKRKGQSETWITQDMKQAYTNLFNYGFAHCIEARYEGHLVGGLYGLAIGNAFFGESMFHKKTDASKICFYHLIQYLKNNGYKIVDAQQETAHLHSLGGRLIPRKEFLEILSEQLRSDLRPGKWTKNSERIERKTK